MQVDADLLSALLNVWPVGRLATVTPAGDPHVVPVVFAALEGCVYSPVDGKRKSVRPLARLANVTAHRRASLLLDHYADDWQALWWLRLDGPAEVVSGDAVPLAAVARRLAGKYPQYRDVAPFSGTPTLLRLRWERVSAWAQSGDVEVMRRAVSLSQKL